MTHPLNSTVIFSSPQLKSFKLSKRNLMHHITSFADGKYIFTTLFLLLTCIILIFQLDSHYRRQLQSHEEWLRKIEREITELRNERERREVVLRKEIGKAREEIMRLGKELSECRERVRREREADRNVDMEEKLCLIRGLKEIAAVKEAEAQAEVSDAGSGERLKGLGIVFNSPGSDDTDSVVSDEDDEALRLRIQADEEWEKFDEACGKDVLESEQRQNLDHQQKGNSNILIDIDEELEEDCPGTPKTQGERLFPPQQEFPLLHRTRTHRRSFKILK